MIKPFAGATLACSLTAIGLAVVPAAPTHAVATHLYVSETGTDTGGCGSASPCATVSYALRQGVWPVTIHVSGRIHDHISQQLPETIITGEGAASPAILDGSGTGTVLFNAADSELRSLRIENGEGDRGAAVDAGGIYNYTDLTLRDVTVADNTTLNRGGGIANVGGTLTLIRSTVTGNTSRQAWGGGIYTTSHSGNAGTLRIYDSTISDNHADRQAGGGIFAEDVDASVTIVRSTVSGNSAATGGGVYGPTLTIIDSTFHGNSGSRGSAISNYGTGGSALVTGTTVAGNSGGPAVYQAAKSTSATTITIGASIVSGNAGSSGSNCVTAHEAFVSLGYNLTDDADGTACGMTAPSDRLGLDPGLDPLQDNGGPTFTMYPTGAGAAPVIPQGTVLSGVQACQGQDQRTYTRPATGQTTCTSGAVEPGLTAAAAPHVTSGLSATVKEGATFSIAITATGAPTPILTATGLPAGVTFVDNLDGTATLSGSTTAVGDNVIDLSAWNGVDPADEPTFTLKVMPVFSATYVTVSDATTVETNSGAHHVTFTLTRRGNATATSSVTVSTTGGTATAGSDFTTLASTLVTFAAGERTKTVTVSVSGDTSPEANETFGLNVSSPVGTTISDNSGTATIVNDDATYVSVRDVNITEGNTGAKTLLFTVTRSGSTSDPVAVTAATANGTAVAGTDFTALPPTLVSFAAGERTKTVAVAVTGDMAAESSETFQLNLTSPVGATVSDASGTATIVDNDSPPGLVPTTFFSVGDASVVEGRSGTRSAVLTVKRTGNTTGSSSVDYATEDDTADISDYSQTSGTLFFSAGETTKTVTVGVLGDRLLEADEIVVLRLTAPVDGRISDATAGVTIVSDDATFVSVADTAVVERNAVSTTLVFTLRRRGSLDGSSSLTATTADGTATAGSDYTAHTDLVSFAAGETVTKVSVTVTGDTAIEGNETVLLDLTQPVGVVVADTSGTGTIVNND